jgi:hypothetical protein
MFLRNAAPKFWTIFTQRQHLKNLVAGSHKLGEEGLSGAGEGHHPADPVQPPRHRRQDVRRDVRPHGHAAQLTDLPQAEVMFFATPYPLLWIRIRRIRKFLPFCSIRIRHYLYISDPSIINKDCCLLRVESRWSHWDLSETIVDSGRKSTSSFLQS